MGDLAWPLTTDTQSHAVVSGHVETQVDAETWAVSLALDVERTGDKIVGLAEDAGSWYPGSISRAAALLGAPFEPTIQKDAWHFMDHAQQTVRDGDRRTLQAMETAERKAHCARPGFLVIHDFQGYEAAHEQAERAIATADAIRLAADLLPEALAIVDRRSDRIMDPGTATWCLAEVEAHLTRTGGDLAPALAGTLHRQAEALVGFHDYLQPAVAEWRQQARDQFDEPELVAFVERYVACAWRLRRAVTNGHCEFTARAKWAADYVHGLCQHDEVAPRLAEDLDALLDNIVRTSAASENVNSILRVYLWGRRYFPDRRTAQNWLNLLLLWYNLRVFQRGKRAGKSPFQLAGVTVPGPDGQPTTDWLVALGYAPAA